MTRSEIPVLTGEIELELRRLVEVERQIQALAAALGPLQPDNVQLMAAAGFLHNFYNGVENCLMRIARGVDEHVPAGPTVHRELLDQMTAEVPGIRPAVLSDPLLATLDEYRRFRHAFRHMYFFDLRWELLRPLVTGVPAARQALELALRKLLATLPDPG
jgi:hypothetical protein